MKIIWMLNLIINLLRIGRRYNFLLFDFSFISFHLFIDHKKWCTDSTCNFKYTNMYKYYLFIDMWNASEMHDETRKSLKRDWDCCSYKGDDNHHLSSSFCAICVSLCVFLIYVHITYIQYIVFSSTLISIRFSLFWFRHTLLCVL